MTFKEFLEKRLGNSEGYLTEVTQFKAEDPERYARYRDRVKKVETYYLRNHDSDSIRQPLTVDTFYNMERLYNSMCALMKDGEPTDMRE